MPGLKQDSKKTVWVLGDQLNRDFAALAQATPSTHRVLMVESSAKVRSKKWHIQRAHFVITAMRRFAQELCEAGFDVDYRKATTLSQGLKDHRAEFAPSSVSVMEPASHAALTMLRRNHCDIVRSNQFLCHYEDFAQWKEQLLERRKTFKMEDFYRWQRSRLNYLMTHDGEPETGTWNYDSENRKSFSKDGPGLIPTPIAFPPDKITKQVVKLVNEIYPDHPGDLNFFDWPVTASQAEETLKDFLDNRLNQFGDYQDAMWMNQPWLYHSRLAAAMNLHILHPLKVITQAEDYFKSGKAPLAAVEGFIRQILGWREYVRGIYWLYMPQYLERNTLNANHDLPAFFWTANTDLNCLNQAIGQTLKHGYAHHIQRLMITGLFCLLYGVKPTQVHEWYLAVYVDAVEWVELPNSLGMSQYADGGVMASKPYIASGKYIDRMGNYCKKCKYDPAKSVGEDACPFTTMYWDFLMRHEKLLSANPRMGMQVRNLNRLSDNTKEDIKSQANAFRLSLKMI